MRTFYLERLEDETGISGTGVISQGVEFSDGTCVMKWLTDTSSIAIYKSVDDLIKIHGHAGKTVLRWDWV
jgi:hypothetical protein